MRTAALRVRSAEEDGTLDGPPDLTRFSALWKRSGGLPNLMPSGRAVLGGLLVALCAFSLSAIAGRSSDESRRYLVAKADIAAGQTLAVEDLAWESMQLSDEVALAHLNAPDDVVGQVAAVPIAANGLIPRQLLVDSPASTTSRTISLEMESAQVLHGDLSPGERVDVVKLTDDRDSSKIIATDAIIESIQTQSDIGLGSGGTFGVTITVEDREAAVEVLAADTANRISFIKASGTQMGEGDE